MHQIIYQKIIHIFKDTQKHIFTIYCTPASIKYTVNAAHTQCGNNSM